MNAQDRTSATGSLAAASVADFFVWLDGQQDEPDVTPMKLQKLLYYAQAQHLAVTGGRLFDEDIEAWDHGPVVRSQYHRFKEFGRQVIVCEQSAGRPRLDESVCEFLRRIWDAYGGYSAARLRAMTHDEAPYQQAYDGASDTVIPDDVMFAFFHSGRGAARLVTHSDDCLIVTREDLAAVDAVDDAEFVRAWREASLAYA